MTENSFHTGRSRLPMIIIAVAVLLVAGIVIGVLIGRASGPAPTAETTTPTESSPAATATGPAAPGTSASPPETAAPSTPGSDASERFGTPSRSLVTTGQVFIRGWLETDPDRRRDLLGQSATPELVKQLMLTAPGNIPDETVESMKVTGQAAHSGEIMVKFASGNAVILYLAYDPVAKTEWAVFSIAKWG